ncbi:VOC family protein [Albimonas sp. CAU 1670]|uniref:VOC family protein n=1 Tax=Albimonas sp. CAU 1670 TaxID=3032599 RepID=UPI0023D9EDF8|nr:VOC family protein [Albimonas sp. CAU 1670]MDF2233630.1 VOC family protein [Albimonas sp. CAU 1670]
MQMTYTVLPCADLARSRAFYEQALGLPVVEDLEGWVSFDVGGTLLTLRPRGVWWVCDDGPMPAGASPVQIALRIPAESVDDWHDRLMRHGATLLRAPTNLPKWGHRAMFFADPDRNIVELYAEL